ncbi:C-Maf-inducing protein isoform X2 [Folsomia candida]|uniref:C-Maf-inducing protein isoform X2 n=1 Tax=Folsomia candida TaxID=158441 RepID=UPI001604FD58|nr:C-Maf-inducing protein isoform X2 [Folsomia candida]
MGHNDEELTVGESTPMTSPSTPSTHNSSPVEQPNLSISSNCSSNPNSGTSSKLSSPTQEVMSAVEEEGPMNVTTGRDDPDADSQSSTSPNNSSSIFNTSTDVDVSEEEVESDKLMPANVTASESSQLSESKSTTGYVCNSPVKEDAAAILKENQNIKIRLGDDEAVTLTKSAEPLLKGNCTVVGNVTRDGGINVATTADDIEGTVSSSCSSRGRDSKKKSFGFQRFTKLNLRVFSRSSRSTERLDVEEAAQAMLMNNQLQSPPAPSVSKSSSESNIPMCHNSLDNLANDLPASRSTDSSCLLPCPGDMLGGEPAVASTSASGQSTSGTRVQSSSECVAGASSSSSDGSSCGVTSSSSSSSSSGCSAGPKFKLVTEGDVQVCKVKHGNNLMDKFIGSKLLRRWETHHIYLNDSCISSKTAVGSLSGPVPYWQMQEVYVCVRLDSKSRYVIRIVLPDGSLLLQGSNSYVRDQWYYSILWKKNIFKYQNLMRSSRRPEVILKELKSLVDFATTTPLQDDCVSHVPIEIVSNLLDSAGDLLGKNQAEEVLVALSPLLERSHPPPSLCRFFSRQCRAGPRCPLVGQLFTPVVRRAVVRMDFGKYPYMRRFIQDFIQALNCHNDGVNVVRNFVKSMHGPASSCPHPRVLSNLVSVCLAAMFQIFSKPSNLGLNADSMKDIPYDEQLLCYLAVLDTISEFEDWRPSLAQLLQPIPFPEEALSNSFFTRSLSSVIRRIGTDHRCDVHQMVLGIRDGKEGYFSIFSPSFSGCSDDGELWGLMLERLLSCCHRRKRFLSQLGGKLLGSCLLLALREHEAAQEALCTLLEWQIVQSDDQRVQIATTLQSTPTGRANYLALCSRQLHLKELQQKGGPRKLTLPSRSTDNDLAKLLSCGSFGNLECLSLAFTGVTSACAEQLIKLPSLRYLNLWCTQFGDLGLVLISEHLPNLQVLNLCETRVTDKGLLSLTSLTSLRKLNLNSTHLSAQTLQSLKMKLPALKEIDVRYTDAW